MKVTFAFVTIFAASMGFLVIADLMAGSSLSQAVNTLLHSFAVTTMEEKTIVLIAIAMPFIIPFVTSIRGKKKSPPK